MTKIFKKIEYSEVYKNLQSEYGTFFLQTQRILKSTLVMIFCCHFFSQILIYQYKASEEQFILTNVYTDNWVRIHYCPEDSESTRAYCTVINDITYTEILITSWQWAIQTVTTVGQGDILSASMTDRTIRIVCILIGVYVFTDFITSITFDTSDSNADDNSQQRFKIDTLRRKQKINGQCSLQLELLVNKSKSGNMREDQDLIEKLPDLKMEKVYSNIFKTMCSKIPDLSHFTLEQFIAIFKHMKLIGKADTDLIQQAGKPVDGF